MKRLTEAERQRYQRLAQRRSEHDLLRKSKAKGDRVRESRIKDIRKRRYAAFTAPIHSLQVPSDFSLTKNFDQVVEVAQNLRYLALTRRFRVGMDYSNVKEVGPAAALFMAAEVYRCRYIQPRLLRVTGIHPTDIEVARLLKDMGFNSLLNIGDPTVGNVAPPVEYLKYKTSNDVNGELAKELRLALEAGSSAIPPIARKAMYDGLTEAMTNVLHHAYPRNADRLAHVMNKRWWMAASIDRQQNEFMIIFYDQGIGIPTSLPRTYPVELWGGILKSLGLPANDATMIKAATIIGRTRTGKIHRGRGLQNVLDIVNICEDSELRILSGRGEYVYHSDRSERLLNHRRHIGGTLIQWRVARTSFRENEDNDDKDD